jgi:hypothetical protein
MTAPPPTRDELIAGVVTYVKSGQLEDVRLRDLIDALYAALEEAQRPRLTCWSTNPDGRYKCTLPWGHAGTHQDTSRPSCPMWPNTLWPHGLDASMREMLASSGFPVIDREHPQYAMYRDDQNSLTGRWYP